MATIGLPPLQPLPRQVKPFPRETLGSFISRLAQANRLDAKALRLYIVGHKGRGALFPAARLALATNLPESTLRHAIPDLIGGHPAQGLPSVTQRRRGDGPPCRRCALARGITGSVQCWKPPENVICLRHRRWIEGWSCENQPDLSAQPDILQAHKRHLRLVRRFGRDAVARAYTAAYEICLRWHDQFSYYEGFQQRMRIFHGPEGRALPATHPSIAAAIYPQAVELTTLLASPYWQSQAAPGNEAGQRRLAEEARRRAAPGYPWPQPGRPRDPLCQWILDQGPYARSVWMLTQPRSA